MKTNLQAGAEPGRTMPRMIEMRAIPLARISLHPDAEAFGADEEDRSALRGSVAACGVLSPISVVEVPNERGGEEESRGGEEVSHYLVIDGCGRFEALREHGATLAPCLVFDLGDFSVREFALHRNLMQRKVTTGQRVLCALAVQNSDPQVGVSRETRKAISESLGCSEVDIAAARELIEAAGKGENEPAREVYESVLAGRTPVRRWKAAMKGLAATKNAPKKATNYAALAERVAASLRTIFAAWPNLKGATRDEIGELLAAALASAPEELRADLGLADTVQR